MSPDEARASYRAALDAAGEFVTVRRYTGTGAGRPYFDAEVRARVTGYEAREMIGPNFQQGDRKAIVLAEDLIARQFALPIRPTDHVIVRGRECAIVAPDDSTRRVRGELIAYELRVRG